MKNPISTRALPLSAWLALSMAASAQIWSGTLNGTTEAWNSNANWTPATFPNAADAVANINVDFSANKIIQLNQAITVGSLTIGDSSGTSTLSIATGTGTNPLTFDVTSGSAILSTSGGATPFPPASRSRTTSTSPPPPASP